MWLNWIATSPRGNAHIRRTSSEGQSETSVKNRRLEMMNCSKPCGPSGGFPAPSPKRRRSGLGVPCSPSPQPSPPGEGETFIHALAIRPSWVVVWHRTPRSEDCNCNIRIFQHRASALPLLGERVGVRGKEANSNPRRTTIPGTVTFREGPRQSRWFPNLIVKRMTRPPGWGEA
jgi:hypothetical protein